MVPKKIESMINKFAKEVEKNGIKIKKILLFGSYASESYKPYSDIDIAVISSDFGKSHYEDNKLLRKLAWRIDERIEPIAISEKSFNKDSWIPLINEIKAKGVAIKLKDIAA